MGDENNSTTDHNTTGGQGGNGGNDGGAGGNPPEMVPITALVQVQNELKTLKDQNKNLATELGSTKSKLTEYEKKQLEGSGDYKKLYDQEKAAKEELAEKYSGTTKNVHRYVKEIEIRPKLIAAGLNPDALTLLDHESLEEVEVETTSSGRMMVQGADTFVEAFKKKHGYAFNKNPPRVNGGGGTGSGGNFNTGPVTVDQVNAAEHKFLISRKGEDEAEWKRLWTTYKQQKSQVKRAQG